MISGWGRSAGAVIPALGSGRYSPGPNIVLPSWFQGADPHFTLNVFWGQPGALAPVSVFLGLCIDTSYQEYAMKERGQCTPGVCPGATANGQTVAIYVDHHHPLLQLQRALPWEALYEVRTRHWRRAGKNTDGRPGLAWDVTLYVPLVVLMLVKHLNARDMESYLAEHVVARVFIGRQDAPRPQIRDHSNVARAYTALGKDGVEEINALILRVAQAFGFADVRILSSDTTAQ